MMIKKNKEKDKLWRLSLGRLGKNRLSVFAGFILLCIVLFTIFGPIFSPHKMSAINVVLRYKPPTLANPFGTDMLGQDMMTRIMLGGRISLTLASISAIVTILSGTLIGALSGYYGKWVDKLLMRFTEFIYVLPLLPMIIAFSAIFAFKYSDMTRMVVTMVIYGLLSFPTLARMVRGEILLLKETEFMKAAELLGISKISQIYKHLLPNIIGVVVASSTTIIANAILLELTLSFVGMGFPPPTPTWGNLIPNIRGDNMVTSGYYWMWFYPVTFISLTIISINLLGEGLRDALDPKGEGR